MHRTFLRIFAGVVLTTAVSLAVSVGSMITPDINPVELESKYATPPSRFVEANGLRYHIRDRGAGPAIVLVHGQSANLFTWEEWASDLARDHRVISFDLPGHGLTGPDPNERYSWSELAEGIDALANELGLESFVLAGNSLGGAVSLSYALRHGNRLDALVLLDPIGAPREEPKPLIFELYATPGVGQLLTSLTPEWLVRASIEATYGDPTLVTDEQVRLFAEMMARAGNREAARQIVAQPNDPAIPHSISKLAVPTLLIWGGKDTWVLPKYGEWFRSEMQDASLVMFPDLGHMPMTEAPTATVAPLRSFLREVEERDTDVW